MAQKRRYNKTTGGTRGQSRAGKGRGSPARRTTGRSTAARRPIIRAGGRGTYAGSRSTLIERLAALLRRNRTSAPTRGRAKRLAPPPPATKAAGGLSLDRKLDLVGVVLVFVGFPTLLSLFSVSHNPATASWLRFLSQAFGWGAYLFPVTLIVLGLWLILRNFERIPRVALERVLGLVLLFLGLLVALQLFLAPETREASYSLGRAGQGGGFLGAVIFEVLRAYLGLGGAVIALVAWLLISLVLTLDMSVVDLFGWMPPLVLRLQDWWDERRNHHLASDRPVIFPGYRSTSGEGLVASIAGGQETGPGPAAPFTSLENTPQATAWALPPLEQILEAGSDIVPDDEYDRQRAHIVEETLASFGAPVNVIEINRGPTITQFGVEPDFVESRSGRTRVRVGKIAALADDLALALAARTIRVQAPVPGKGYVGIEVPNEQIALVALRDVIESEAFHNMKSSLRFALGQDVSGHAVAADLAAMPHLLIAGATGSGKSVCVNAIICCLLLHNTPDDLRLIMVDPKRVELTGYNGIPHLLAPVVVEMERVIGALQWVLREMDLRYHKLAQLGTRNIIEYNAKVAARGDRKLPRLVVIIDELADLMMLAPEETERTITRLAQLARATGIHLIISTQRPSVDVVTGLIKANFPSRIAFAVASNVDSRVILDQPGAERLLGRGDMLFQAPDAPAPLRLQGVHVSEVEILRLVQYWRSFSTAAPAPTATGGVVDALPPGLPLKQIPLWEEMAAEEEKDPLYDEAVDLARRQGRASISMLQRRLRIGYTRAARLVETMQEKGIIGAEAGPQGFEILDYGPAAPPVDEG